MTIVIVYILFMIIGISILVIWTRDISYNPHIDLSKGFFKARDKDSGSLYWTHWLAEFITAFLLVILPVLIFLDLEVARQVMPFAVGALFYSSLNSLGWTFASRDRYGYIAPMAFALLLSLIYFLILLFQ